MTVTCSTCKHCKRARFWWILSLFGENLDKCQHPKAKFTHPVTGVTKQWYCDVERGPYGCCGEPGNNWESKETK